MERNKNHNTIKEPSVISKMRLRNTRSTSLPYISRHAIGRNSCLELRSNRIGWPNKSNKAAPGGTESLQAHMPVYTINDKPIRKYMKLKNSASNNELSTTSITWDHNPNPNDFYDTVTATSTGSPLIKSAAPLRAARRTETRKSCCDSISTVLCSEISSTKSSKPKSAGDWSRYKGVWQGNPLKDWLVEHSEVMPSTNVDELPPIQQPGSSCNTRQISIGKKQKKYVQKR